MRPNTAWFMFSRFDAAEALGAAEAGAADEDGAALLEWADETGAEEDGAADEDELGTSLEDEKELDLGALLFEVVVGSGVQVVVGSGVQVVVGSGVQVVVGGGGGGT
jgi:hypothetical protein